MKPVTTYIKNPVFLAGLAVALLSISFKPGMNLGWLVMVSFVPLFFLFDKGQEFKGVRRFAFFTLLFVIFFVWQLLSVEWLKSISFRTYLIGSILNSLHYWLPILITVVVWNRRHKVFSILFFIVLYLLSEYILQISPIGTPFFLLGYALGDYPSLILHYRWVGVEGATIWILGVNACIYLLLLKGKSIQPSVLLVMVVLIALPLIALIKIPEIVSDRKINVNIVHTSRDPYSQKSLLKPEEEIDSLLSTVPFKHSGGIYFFPEVTVTNLGWISDIDEQPISRIISRYSKNYNVDIVIGAIGFYPSQDNGAYISCDNDLCYTTHNISVLYSAENRTQIQSKEKFIPFQERIPFLEKFAWMSNMVESVGMKALFSPLKSAKTPFKLRNTQILTALCYESIFPLRMMQYSEINGPIAVLTNEKWLHSDEGKMQYKRTITPLAIQSGKYVLRCSNYGYSGIVSPSGETLDETNKEGAQVLSRKINLTENASVYAAISGWYYTAAAIIFFVQLILLTTGIKFK